MLVTRLGGRALVQNYDTEGTANFEPDDIVRLWVCWPTLNPEGRFWEISVRPAKLANRRPGTRECSPRDEEKRDLSRIFRWCNGKMIRLYPCMTRIG